MRLKETVKIGLLLDKGAFMRKLFLTFIISVSLCSVSFAGEKSENAGKKVGEAAKEAQTTVKKGYKKTKKFIKELYKDTKESAKDFKEGVKEGYSE
jgi:hypothetical protein